VGQGGACARYSSRQVGDVSLVDMVKVCGLVEWSSQTLLDFIILSLCVLCSTAIRMSGDNLFVYNESDDGLSHLWESDEELSVQGLCRRQIEQETKAHTAEVMGMFQESQLLVARVDVLDHLRWRHYLKGLLGQALLEKNHSLLERTASLVEHYEDLDRISLLELAVWKACCLNNPKQILSYISWQRWVNYGWKSNKMPFFRCNEIVIIVQAILPFLGKTRSSQSGDLKPKLKKN